ncbi:hypothetical protein C8A05DRAFT_18627 [Staphylotrichum tortipilum]|uniref:Heterokaryon incompatibility domain-containing protein n=1 Tax=Staphylotrichum tortipilum TaxID=2831512 RepID=A0AAN6MDA3_9PEZI|nr:hypothetical protein C8A05DRAFT_18627 [Staphylotrichum longicolle]
MADCEYIKRACQRAQSYNMRYLWIDAICVDHNSCSEVTESVLSSFDRLWNAALCMVYLFDLSPVEGSGHGSSLDLEQSLSRCGWFARCWTVQELVAAQDISFFDRDFNLRLTKSPKSPRAVLEMLGRVSGVDVDVLAERESLTEFSMGRRLSWAVGRHTARPEDMAYSLQGICGVAGQLPPCYGEGGRRAFVRLQKEILMSTADLSIMAWRRERTNDNDSSMVFSLAAARLEKPPTWARIGLCIDLPTGRVVHESLRFKRSAELISEDLWSDSLHHNYKSSGAEPYLRNTLPTLVTVGLDAWDSEKQARSRAISPSKPEDDSDTPWDSSSSSSNATSLRDSDSTAPVSHHPRHPPPRPNRLACPFFRLDPTQHLRCLARSLPDIASIATHLAIVHRQPEYCPVCGDTFTSAAARDAHIVTQSCEMVYDAAAAGGVPVPGGVTERQAETILGLDLEDDGGGAARERKRRRGNGGTTARGSGADGVSEEDRWFWIWGVLFPGAPRPRSTCLDSSWERELVGMKRFWDRAGPRVVEGWLEREGQLGFGGVQRGVDLEILCAEVLAGMMERRGLGPESLRAGNDGEK